MLKLQGMLPEKWDAEPMVLRLRSAPHISSDSHDAILLRPGEEFRHIRNQIAFRVAPEGRERSEPNECVHTLPPELSYLQDGDIIFVDPRRGSLWVMYRRESAFNSMLLTEQCNSRCLMCSQPPKLTDDSYLADLFLQAIPLMDPETKEMGITGGEPTLIGERLLDVISACETYLPTTTLHMLSNGRMFSYLDLCQDIAAIAHHDFMIGIPLYSDIASKHDFVVQARGAFDQTVRGIMNLQRCGVRVEVRVVLERQTIDRLPELARFIARNLPFVEHVALMGLEIMGYAKMNLNALWIDPVDYKTQLLDATRILSAYRMNVSIYNHQLCTIDEWLWPFARKSISDWKNEYLPACEPCEVRDQCGGFFASSRTRHSRHICPVSKQPPQT